LRCAATYLYNRMNHKKTILALCGSTQQKSTNLLYINAIAAQCKEKIQVTVFDGLTALPHFNPENNTENTPENVTRFRQLLAAADGVLICTPEYAHGVPGTLKNALDWTVTSGEFFQKPVLLITASTDGRFGHPALLETLRVIEAKQIDGLQLLISFAKTKINAEAVITDAITLQQVTAVTGRFIEVMEANI
jgi:chromate reductase, NAD(P)H dehydrogenase (quinone)